MGPILLLTAQAGTFVGDTGDLEGLVDVSATAGQAVRISFNWSVPETFSGPAFFQLDNVLVNSESGGDGGGDGGDGGGEPVPSTTGIGIALLVLLLGGSGAYLLRRK